MKIGDRVSHYEIIEVLGAGGMGVPAPFESASRDHWKRIRRHGTSRPAPYLMASIHYGRRRRHRVWQGTGTPANTGTNRLLLVGLAAALIVYVGAGAWYLHRTSQVRAAQHLMQRIPALFEKESYPEV
jgi:hypothetical protein